MPWKKRPKQKNVKKSQGNATQPRLSPSYDDYRNSIASKPPQATPEPQRSMKCSGLKSHPAMFYSYYLAKGYEYRKICAPKKRACDGYFGCHDANSIDRKATGQE